ncbi:polysaccharide pyruvyl transferase family protein [Janibacter alittae]|uniref:Polysaccharide pyruvyl transferase family protein n=1 Tax=Janibacter alittae TaxID=3115209 RepID=A0ABZ2MI40_9MICO
MWHYDARTLVVSFEIAGSAAAIDLVIDQGVVTGSVLARDKQLRRHLRNTLVGKAELVVDSSERHLIGSWPSADARGILHKVIDWTHWLTRQPKRAPSEYSGVDTLPADHVGAFWWDNRRNFGDAVGPWLVDRITGRTPVNSRRVGHDGPTVLSVGSIVAFLNRDHAAIWGSGLMRPLSGDRLERLKGYDDVSVHAVRGHVTAAELREKLNWHVPDVYGDPALLLPKFYTPRPSSLSAGSTVVVPHYSHAKHFAPHRTDDSLHVVDVGQGLERVVDEIASADNCVSTSLHGLIIAQAYGVPWVWLRMDDHQLGGDQFKFDDFFSTLTGEGVSRCDVTSDDVGSLDITSIAQDASLPSLNISLDELLAAFPLPSGDAAHRPWQPPRVNVRAATVKARVSSMSRSTKLRRLKRLKRRLVEPRVRSR